ncbi:NAD(P)H-quinone oxidoreductase [Actinomycetospora cinnamomea]|uniref:Putative PIG3 family NAD(P)H quinone oxidoreductase n=1 Tax=Actinomycetospora cinnamomea TaxID=663609 RepID=A0A2U1FBG4_9PSEU|nr:NAD(P)H-quinone oxidoreductase [Actinomycetospora cinnamomea]PVZ09504.1 putative PIG3 family NAD(P)H quinone oxidoreductase [Actinomycetospora cinnamomea]
MYAISIREPGGPEVLEWTEHPDPEPGPNEVVVDVVASAVNRADVLQRQGNYPPPPGASEIPGLECSGRIAALGPDVEGWSVGDEVCALLAGGGYAEKVAVPVPQLLPVPRGVSLVDAGGLPEVACTVWSNLAMTGHLRAGETLLVHGGSGGIGTHAIQVGKALGARVLATAGSPERLQTCLDLGADVAIDYHDDLPSEVASATDDRGVDVILDNMGASNLKANLASLATGGRLVIIGLMGGAKTEINLGTLLARRLSVGATTLRGRPVEGPDGKGAIVASVREELWPLVEQGTVRPVIHEYLPAAEASRAHAALDEGGVVGKLVLVVRDEDGVLSA